MGVAGQGLGVRGGLAVDLRAAEQYLANAQHLRAMRVFRGLALGVVFAMHRHPLGGDHAGGQPQPETEEMGDRRVQVHAPVRLVAVEVNGNANDRDMRESQCDNDVPPKGQIQHAVSHPKGLLVSLICCFDKASVVRDGVVRGRADGAVIWRTL